jgi:hypothetical protein
MMGMGVAHGNPIARQTITRAVSHPGKIAVNFRFLARGKSGKFPSDAGETEQNKRANG